MDSTVNNSGNKQPPDEAMTSTVTNTSNAQPSSSPAAVPVARLATISTSPQQFTNVPYTAAQPTPNAMTKMQSTLPPIAMAKPLDSTNLVESHYSGGSNIPVKQNTSQDIYCSEVSSADPNYPYVTVTTVASPTASGNTQDGNLGFALLQKCRWGAGFLMAYYMITFLFLQPLLLGILGLLTAVLGLHSSRAPMDLHRFHRLRWYIRANYVMLGLNIWMLIVTVILSEGTNSYVVDPNGNNSTTSSGDEAYVQPTDSYSNDVNFCIGILVAINTIMHVRCLRTAQLLAAELLVAGINRQPSLPVLVLATTNPVSTV